MKTCRTCKSSYPHDYAVCPRDGTPLEEAGVWTEGTVVRGKYQILSKIGEGGMGAVYKARHQRFGELRALKVISAQLSGDANILKRFEKEAVLTRKLQHPNAVRVEDIDEAEDGRPFIVMEYIEGRSLKDAIQAQGTILPARALAIGKQVASALDAAHQLGMVHRDIKPENIVLVEAPSGEEAKVLDFGIARIRDIGAEQLGGRSLTETGVIIGSPPYMSPEQAMGLKGDQLDGRSDLYSLGVVMYQMLTGALPLKADTTMEMLMAHIHTPPIPIREARPDLQVPDSVGRLVMGLLEKKPESRPQSAKALIEAIDRVEKELAGPVGATLAAQPGARLAEAARHVRGLEVQPEGIPRHEVSQGVASPRQKRPAAQPLPTLVARTTPQPGATAPPTTVKSSRWRRWALSGALLALLGGFGWRLYVRRSKGTFAEVHSLGHELMQKGDYSGAIGEYRQALKLRPDLDHLRLDLALALEAKGERREALEEFEVVCARSPDLRECKENYRRLLKQFHMPPRP